MIDTESVQRALGSLERFAPAEADVLAGMREGITRRRRRRQVASVVGVSGAASLMALGVVLVAPGRAPDQTGATPGPASSSAPETSVPIANPPAPPALSFTVGWVPDGYTLNAWYSGSHESDAQYAGTKDFQAIVLRISADRREAEPEDTEEPATIAGRAGVIRRLGPDRSDAQLIWQLADGRWASVGGRVPTVPVATLHRVAESVSVEPTPMTTSWTLSTLPDGYQVAGWSGGEPLSASLTLCRSAVDLRAGEHPADCLNVTVRAGTAPAGTQMKAADGTVIDFPVDREQVVNGVHTRASADGTIVYAQLDAGHWVHVFSQGAGVDLLREVAATAVNK